MNRLAILKELKEEQIELLRPLSREFFCQPGMVIFRQGERAEFLYLVLEGNVRISFKPYDGVPITVSHVEKGGLFGWSALVGSENYSSSAMAVQEVEAFRFEGRELRKFCRKYPEAGKEILECLAKGVSARWREAHKQVQSILFQNIAEHSKFH